MRIFRVQGNSVSESTVLKENVSLGIPDGGFMWIACSRTEFEQDLSTIQAALTDLCGTQLLELHVSDLLNTQLPSHYDYTTQYDVLVFRRLAAGSFASAVGSKESGRTTLTAQSGPPILHRIDTSPVGFAIFDRVLLTVHPDDCSVREAYAARLQFAASAESRASGVHLPTSPADMMLRIVNQMVDGYLALRRELTQQLDHWQSALLNPKTRFNNWSALLDARIALHQLDEICEEQRSSIQDWIEAVKTWPDAISEAEGKDRELLQVRSRDVLEHIERVVHHVRRLEQSAETAVQMHFSAQSHRTNDIMRTLTSLTAIFLPLNLIAAIFGMNFDFIPLLHVQSGFWWAMGSMATIASVLAVVFWRKRYLARTER